MPAGSNLRPPSPTGSARAPQPLSPGSARIEAKKSMMISSREFERVETLLGQDLQARLKSEHDREVEFLWDQQIALREELERIVDLMQNEVLPREKAMHDMIEKLEEAYKVATGHMAEQMGSHVKNGGLQSHQKEQVLGLRTPLEAMERELERLDDLLSHDVVAPDIQGWQPNRAYAPRAQPTTSRPAASASRPAAYQGLGSARSPVGGATSSPRFAAGGGSSTPRTAGAPSGGYAGRYGGGSSPSGGGGGASPYGAAAGSLRSPYQAANAPRSPYGGAGFGAGSMGL